MQPMFAICTMTHFDSSLKVGSCTWLVVLTYSSFIAALEITISRSMQLHLVLAVFLYFMSAAAML